MFAASASFATPIGPPTNTLAHSAGNHRLSDFARLGRPANLIAGAAARLPIGCPGRFSRVEGHAARRWRELENRGTLCR